jgi:hypothetical protein
VMLLRGLGERSVVEPLAAFPAPINAPSEEAFEVIAKALSRDSRDVAREALGTDVAQGHVLKALPTVSAVVDPPTQDRIQAVANVVDSHALDIAGGALRATALHRCNLRREGRLSPFL